jgi:very-short-patch-repair endonuclease
MAFLQWLFNLLERIFSSKSNTKPQQEHQFEVKTKRFFFTRAEHNAFLLLEQALQNSNHRIFPKVRVLDLVEPIGDSRLGTLNRIRGMHIDFLLINANTFETVLALEVDGSSHQTERQKAADANKNAVLAQAGIPLIRVKNGVSGIELRRVLAPYLEKSENVKA